MSGALAALEYFEVPDADRPGDGLRRRQAGHGHQAHRGRRVQAYPDALRFVLAVTRRRHPIAAASSSKNAGLFLRQIRLDTFAAEQGLHYDFVRPGLSLLDFFDADISGRDFAQGKPHPEIFLTGAAELGVATGDCFVVEDAVSGVKAAKAGGMAALGVARPTTRSPCRRAADLVVTSLDESTSPRLAGTNSPGWHHDHGTWRGRHDRRIGPTRRCAGWTDIIASYTGRFRRYGQDPAPQAEAEVTCNFGSRCFREADVPRPPPRRCRRRHEVRQALPGRSGAAPDHSAVRGTPSRPTPAASPPRRPLRRRLRTTAGSSTAARSATP